MQSLKVLGKIGVLLASMAVLGACSSSAPQQVQKSVDIQTTRSVMSFNQGPRVLMMGDSLLAWNTTAGKSIGHRLSAHLGEAVINQSVPGARMMSAFVPISDQYRNGSWDWIVMNGGGNDLLMYCGCLACENILNRLISKDGKSGRIVETVARLKSTGADIVYLGYMRTNGSLSPVEHCKNIGNRLEQRLALFASQTRGFDFIPLADLVPHGDRSYHDIDKIHPSLKGSDAIGQRVARFIRSRDGQRFASR